LFTQIVDDLLAHLFGERREGAFNSVLQGSIIETTTKTKWLKLVLMFIHWFDHHTRSIEYGMILLSF
jgi:hypothetical protein